MSHKIKILKQELKALASSIRATRKLYRSTQSKLSKNEPDAQWATVWSSHSQLGRDCWEYRHKHIAYCMARGKTYEQIEPKVKDGNQPNMERVEGYLRALREEEADGAQNVHAGPA